jgi:hypothetical protein
MVTVQTAITSAITTLDEEKPCTFRYIGDLIDLFCGIL